MVLSHRGLAFGMRTRAPNLSLLSVFRQPTSSRAGRTRIAILDAIRSVAGRVLQRMRRSLRDLLWTRIPSTARVEVRGSMGLSPRDASSVRHEACILARRRLFAQILYRRALGLRSRFRETAPAIEASQRVAQ